MKIICSAILCCAIYCDNLSAVDQSKTQKPIITKIKRASDRSKISRKCAELENLGLSKLNGAYGKLKKSKELLRTKIAIESIIKYGTEIIEYFSKNQQHLTKQERKDLEERRRELEEIKDMKKDIDTRIDACIKKLNISKQDCDDMLKEIERLTYCPTVQELSQSIDGNSNCYIRIMEKYCSKHGLQEARVIDSNELGRMPDQIEVSFNRNGQDNMRDYSVYTTDVDGVSLIADDKIFILVKKLSLDDGKERVFFECIGSSEVKKLVTNFSELEKAMKLRAKLMRIL